MKKHSYKAFLNTVARLSKRMGYSYGIDESTSTLATNILMVDFKEGFPKEDIMERFDRFEQSDTLTGNMMGFICKQRFYEASISREDSSPVIGNVFEVAGNGVTVLINASIIKSLGKEGFTIRINKEGTMVEVTTPHLILHLFCIRGTL